MTLTAKQALEAWATDLEQGRQVWIPATSLRRIARELGDKNPLLLTDEQERAVCEGECNAASDEYFKARPQLDSAVNRRIFYAGHRKGWLAGRES
jgi:hypothetical protein